LAYFIYIYVFVETFENLDWIVMLS